MKISDVPNQYKMYRLKMSNKDSFVVSGEMLDKIIASQNNYIRFPSGEGFNKSFIVNWVIDKEATRENIIKNKTKLLEENV